MITLELHAAEGGDDAEQFAKELATAIAKYTGMDFIDNGRVITLAKNSLSESYYSELELMVGNHRIKRVPDNEKRGRKHTSTVRVVLMKQEKLKYVRDVQILKTDVREEFIRTTGKGGQNRNKVSSCVRLTYLPTGLQIVVDEQRTQNQNRELAWQRLQDKLNEEEQLRTKIQHRDQKREQLDNGDYWTWFAYRNEVKRPDGKTAAYDRSMSGKLEKILS